MSISVPGLPTSIPLSSGSVVGVQGGAVTRFNNTDLATLFGSGFVAAPGKFYPTPGGGSNAIQAAITAATSAGGGTVELGNTTWGMTGGITFDPTIISLVGDSATLDFSSIGNVRCISLTQGASGGAYKANLRQRVSGIRFKGLNNTTGTLMYIGNPTANDSSSALTIEHCVFEHANIGVEVGDNAYLFRFISCSFGYVTNAISRLTFVNNGEAINYFGCVFFNSVRPLVLNGPNQDHYFYGCSFDYNGRVVYTDSTVEFHGCHFESNSATTAGQTQFETDNSGVLRFFGGGIGLVHGGTLPDYLFSAYPSNGGGRFSLHDVSIDNYAGNQFNIALCNDMSRIKIDGNSLGAVITATGTLPITAIGATTPVDSTTATVLTLPSAAVAWSRIPYGIVVLAQRGVGAPTFAPAGSDVLHATAGIAASVQYGMIAAQIISATEWVLA